MKIFLGLLVCLFTLSPLAAQAQTPEYKFVTSVADSLTATINKGGSRKELETALQRTFADNLDTDFASRLVLGRYWRESTPKQQQDFVAAFKVLAVNNYARIFSQLPKAPYKITSESSSPTINESKLRLEMMDKANSPIKIDFILLKKDGGYKIYDIVINGTSTNATYKDEFGQLIIKGGVDGLIPTLQKNMARNP